MPGHADLMHKTHLHPPHGYLHAQTAPTSKMNEAGAETSVANATSGSLVGGAGVRHVGGNDPRVELLGRQEAELEGGLAQ